MTEEQIIEVLEAGQTARPLSLDSPVGSGEEELTQADTGGADDPDSVRIWVGGQRQTPDLAPGVIVAQYDVPVTGTVSKAADFPAALTPALLRSGAQTAGDWTIRLSGSGAWRLGDISGDSAGRVVGGAFVPIGGVIEFHGLAAQVPAGWLVCDGSAVQENTHPLLYAFLVAAGGVSSGVAPNRTVPRPDHRRRFGVGVTSNLALGQNEGIATDTSRLLGHSHTVDAHDHGLSAGTIATNTQTVTGGANRLTGAGTTGTRSPGTDSFTPPYIAANYIIRAA
jgi:microcystin-dependent protein